MKLKTSFLALGAMGALIAGAQAADLPVAPEPVDYVRVCDAYGTGFFYIPGTDTCLKLGGRVRVEYRFNDFASGGSNSWDSRADNGTSTRARGYFNLDARTNTEYGLLRAVTQLYWTENSGSDLSTSVDDIYVQWGNFSFGRMHSFYDFFTGAAYGILDRNWSDHRTNLLGYTMPFGNGLALNVSVEDGTFSRAGTTFTSDDVTYSYAGHRFPDLVAALNVHQGWGSAQIMGALHEARLGVATFGDDYSGTDADKAAINDLMLGSDAKVGFAVGAGVELNLPVMGATDVLDLQANYVDGALKYVNVSSVADIYPIGNGKTSKAWNVGFGYVRNWAPKWESDFDGSYVDVDTPDAIDADFTRWTVAGNLVWKPVSGLKIGGELQYASTDYDAADTDTDNDLVATFRVQRTF